MNKIIIILVYTAFLFSDFKPTSNIYDPSIGSYKQSSSQAFYFFEYIENIEIGDVIKCYCNEQLVGSRVWSGPYTDVVAMGNNGVSEYTQNYCSIGQTPTFIVQKKHSEKNLLFGSIPKWANNGMFIVPFMSQSQVPNQFNLQDAYPNPFNPTTNINFSIPEFSNVILSIYNAKGQLIETLIDKEYYPGNYSIRWDANTKASGTYFLNFTAGDYSKKQKLILMK